MKILLVEDNKKHKTDAMEAVQNAGHQSTSTGLRPPTLEWAMIALGDLVKAGKPFWVLTDLFFHPTGKLADMNRPTTFPSGLMIMAECQKLGIPCVIVTAGHHHGAAYEPANQALRVMGWPSMVDFKEAKSYEDEAETKNWAEGIRRLEEMAKALMG